MWLTFKRIKQWVRFVFLTFCRSFSVYSVILTVWSYVKGNSIKVQQFLSKISSFLGTDVSMYSLYLHFVIFIAAFCVMLFAYKNDDLRNTRLLQCKTLDTGVILYYFQKNKILRNGALIQIMKIENKTATPYAIGRVDSLDEHNEKRIKVKHVVYNTNHTENLTERSACKKYFYHPYLQDSADIINTGGKITKIIKEERKR